MSAEGGIPSEELDADAAQDEILIKAGVLPLPSHRGTVWKALVVIGVVVAVLGFVLWRKMGGLSFSDWSFVPAALGPIMAIFLFLLGLVCLMAGVVLGARYRKDPYEMRPIR